MDLNILITYSTTMDCGQVLIRTQYHVVRLYTDLNIITMATSQIEYSMGNYKDT